ncbi:MAG: S-adenosylmethionine:tRNAribosyltransferase-isomerase [Candidatus Parcubacteria bacterium]|nr:S-adenosylmethionine:tRNAribosyltransferase-isomerase [Candidatus Parcubacteria bacterium]
MALSDYSYDLPKDRIADRPAEPRDTSRLFAYDTKTDTITLDVFANVARYIPAGSLLVLNDTKVVPARLELTKKTGGKVIILFLFNEWDRGPVIKGLPDRGIAAGDMLYADGRAIVEAVSNEREEFSFRLKILPAEFERLCEERGRTPLPPYIHSGMNESEIRERYQTTFAARPASVAAPTASLHFTDRVFDSLKQKGVGQTAVTLHVGRGTFSPVTEAHASAGRLHAEPVSVGIEAAQLVRSSKEAGRAVIAAGTTVARTLESAADPIMKGEGYSGETAIFIQPPYDFKIVDALITNFHLPGTSLLMLLDAFMQGKGARKTWRELYERAIAEGFRFYSFGDVMLII